MNKIEKGSYFEDKEYGIKLLCNTCNEKKDIIYFKIKKNRGFNTIKNECNFCIKKYKQEIIF